MNSSEAPRMPSLVRTPPCTLHNLSRPQAVDFGTWLLTWAAVTGLEFQAEFDLTLLPLGWAFKPNHIPEAPVPTVLPGSWDIWLATALGSPSPSPAQRSLLN